MAFGQERKMKQVLDSITPLIEKIADERVIKIMDNIQKQQLKAHETFFAGQEERFDKVIDKYLEEKLPALVKKILKEIGEE